MRAYGIALGIAAAGLVACSDRADRTGAVAASDKAAREGVAPPPAPAACVDFVGAKMEPQPPRFVRARFVFEQALPHPIPWQTKAADAAIGLEFPRAGGAVRLPQASTRNVEITIGSPNAGGMRLHGERASGEVLIGIGAAGPIAPRRLDKAGIELVRFDATHEEGMVTKICVDVADEPAPPGQ